VAVVVVILIILQIGQVEMVVLEVVEDHLMVHAPQQLQVQEIHHQLVRHKEIQEE
jgi:hypothetical protein